MMSRTSFHAFFKFYLLMVIFVSFECSAMTKCKSALSYCAVSASKKIASGAMDHPFGAAIGVGVVACYLYNNERTAPYFRPVVNKSVEISGALIAYASRLLYIRPLENALLGVRGQVKNLQQRLGLLISQNDSLQQQIGQVQSNAQWAEQEIVNLENNVQKFTAVSMDQANQVGTVLNSMMRATSHIHSIAQSIFPQLSLLSHSITGRCVSFIGALYLGGGNGPSFPLTGAAAHRFMNLSL